MHNLTPITALGGSSAQVDTVDSVTCREVPQVALSSVMARFGQETQAKIALAKAIGADVPAPARAALGTLSAFWMGPDQWMIEAPIETHEDLADQMKEQVLNTASVTEQTDAWTRFDVSGDDVLAVLELLCSLNTRTMNSGDVSRSSIHHLGCFILCRDTDVFSIYGPRASAGSLHHAIVTAMASAL